MRTPDFFVVGAPRCGTTALHQYFRGHPGIHVIPKEFHFFGRDLDYQVSPVTKEYYEGMLEEAPPEQLLGDVAVWYLTSERAAEEIHAFAPQAKILIRLRNPVEQAYSLHAKLIAIGDEPITDFAEALKAVDARKNGERLPAKFRAPRQAFDYIGVASYADQVARWFDVFGPDRCQVTLLEDVQVDPLGQWQRTLRFLGADPDFDPGLAVVNPNQQVVSNRLRNLSVRPSRGASLLVRTLIPSQTARIRLKRMVRHWNSRPLKRSPLDEGLRAELVRTFEPDVLRLQDLLGRDLSSWLP